MSTDRKRVLFVCIGNSCRSQMAEWFARTYGGDVLTAASAGLDPAMIVAPMTITVMQDKGIQIQNPFPRALTEFDPANFDIIVNISGRGLPRNYREKDVLVWNVEDPIGKKQAIYEQVRDQLEALVMQLILKLRMAASGGAGPRRMNRPGMLR